MSDIVLREMHPNEAKGLQLLALKNFRRSLESPYVFKPKTAILAEKDGKTIGGFLYSIETVGKNKLGFVDFFFVDSAHMGQGVGSMLCKDGIALMWEQGCDYLITFVRDDNVGSWAAFERQGFVRAGLPQFIKAVGLGGLIKSNLPHGYGFSIGCNLYIATNPKSEIPATGFKKGLGFGQIMLHFLMSLALLLIVGFFNIPMILSWNVSFDSDILIGLPLFLLTVIFIFVGTMLFTAFLPWLFLLALMPLFQTFGLNQILVIILLIFRCIPWLSVNIGTSRIFQWNKALWFVMVLATIAVLMLF